MNPFKYDFGYEWQYAWIHVIPLAISLIAIVVSVRRRSRPWVFVGASVLGVWALVSLAIVQFAMRINLPLELPTQAFLPKGSGRVLDLGAGSGRATIMVLNERPQTSVVALDLFREGYGIGQNSKERLRANAEIAGAAARVDVQSGDMREMAFQDASFDAVVTSYAIDHMRQEDSVRALREIHRVLRDDGDLLIEVMEADAYVHFAFPLLGAHGYFGPNNAESHWRSLVESAALEVVESGHVPGTAYVLARKKGVNLSAREE